MSPVPGATVLDYEVYLLMSMRLRLTMSHKESQFEAKLAEHRINIDSAADTHEKMTKLLGGEADYFGNLKSALLGADQDDTSLEYGSVLWPGFNFKAVGNTNGQLESAGYRHINPAGSVSDSPVDVEIWSMDVAEFADRFGPLSGGRKWPFFDEHLPGYEEHEFRWHGENYGAGFSWGLFMFSAMSWD